jgi:flagellar hook-associated protein 3 FlgL
MSNSISATGFFLNNTTLLNNSENELQTLSNQLNTNSISTTLEGYGTQAPTVLNLNDTINQTQSYVQNSTEVGTVLGAYDTTLTQLQSDASKLSSGIGSFSATDPATANNLQTLINGLETDVTATLNTQVGNRFLYSGTRYSTQPVVDLTTLAAPAVPAPFVAVTPNALPAQPAPPAAPVPANSPLPNYDTQSPGTDPFNQAYATQSVNLSPSTAITYGITSNDPSIQGLVYALQQAKAAVTATGAQQAQFLANANSALGTATQGLQSLQQSNAENQVEVTTEQTTQNAAIGTLQTQLGSLTTPNTTNVAAEIAALQNQLQGSFQVTSSILNLSLLNFIK